MTMRVDAWSAQHANIPYEVWKRATFVGYDDCGDVVREIAAEDKDTVYLLVLQAIANKRKGSSAFQVLRHCLEVNALPLNLNS
jgi:hypothetical protein